MHNDKVEYQTQQCQEPNGVLHTEHLGRVNTKSTRHERENEGKLTHNLSEAQVLRSQASLHWWLAKAFGFRRWASEASLEFVA